MDSHDYSITCSTVLLYRELRTRIGSHSLPSCPPPPPVLQKSTFRTYRSLRTLSCSATQSAFALLFNSRKHTLRCHVRLLPPLPVSYCVPVHISTSFAPTVMIEHRAMTTRVARLHLSFHASIHTVHARTSTSSSVGPRFTSAPTPP